MHAKRETEKRRVHKMVVAVGLLLSLAIALFMYDRFPL